MRALIRHTGEIEASEAPKPGAAGLAQVEVSSDPTLGPGLCTAVHGVGKQLAVLHENILQSVLLTRSNQQDKSMLLVPTRGSSSPAKALDRRQTSECMPCRRSCAKRRCLLGIETSARTCLCH